MDATKEAQQGVTARLLLAGRVGGCVRRVKCVCAHVFRKSAHSQRTPRPRRPARFHHGGLITLPVGWTQTSRPGWVDRSLPISDRPFPLLPFLLSLPPRYTSWLGGRGRMTALR